MAWKDQTTCPDCGGELFENFTSHLECKECGMEFCVDENGELFSETYEPEMNELDDD